MKLWQSGLLTAMLWGAVAVLASAQQRVDADATTRPAADAAGYYKASDLIGMEVRGKDNADLGTVQDLFVDRQTNEVEFLILDTGVFADLDGRQPIIPWTIVEHRAGADAGKFFLSIPMTPERIKTAPTVMLSEVTLTGAPEWKTQVSDFYKDDLRERRVSRPELDRTRDFKTDSADKAPVPKKPAKP
jgi:sporulation protein YlmC with PRC-barrel domain